MKPIKFLFWFSLGCILCILLSCSLSKKVTKKEDSSIQASQRDTSHKVSSDSGGTRLIERFKETIYYPESKDTNITNNHYHPTKIVRESESISEAYWLWKMDSMNAARRDTTAHVITQSQTQVKVKPDWTFYLLIVVAVLVFWNVIKGYIPFKISKK